MNNTLKEYIRDRKNRNRFIAYGVLVALLAFVCGVKGLGPGKHYVMDQEGHLIGLSREESGDMVSFPLKLRAEGYGVSSDQDVTVTLKGEEPEPFESANTESSEDLLSRKVEQQIREIGETQEKVVMLPSAIGEDITLDWEIPKNYSAALILVFFPLLVYGSYRNEVKRLADARRMKTENIQKDLPAFIHQLLILTGSGLIFSDAFRYIADSYAQQREKQGYFRSKIIEMQKETDRGSSDLISVMKRISPELGERSWNRIMTAISENQYRGTDLRAALTGESEMLWDQRKKNAEEKGKLAETRLTFPLAILLLVLILVTAAPAVIQVQSG